jgi:hypothetical protein
MSWVATTARYQYLPQLGLAMALGLALSEAMAQPLSRFWPSRPPWLVSVGFAAALAMVVSFYAAGARRVGTEIGAGWRQALDRVVTEVQRRAHAVPTGAPVYAGWRQTLDRVVTEVQRRAHAVPTGAPVYVPNRKVLDWRAVAPSKELPGWAAVFVLAHASNSVEGRRVFFVESNQKLVELLRKDPATRIARLVVTPEEVDTALDGPDSAR